MFKRLLKSTFLFFLIGIVSCGNTSGKLDGESKHENLKQSLDTIKADVITGAERVPEYLPLLENKAIGIVGNQTSVIRNSKGEFIHLVDSLQLLNVNIQKVFAPEHGFRGTADAGEAVKDGVDSKSGLPLISLYGNNKKPSAKSLEGIDLMIFDIQDVGARFYTYISTLHYIMEACAENNIPSLILHRPNPNGHCLDASVL